MESEYHEFGKYYDKIYRYCYSKVKNVHTAEELTQETFLKFMRSGYESQGKELNFLYTVARNLCIDEFRKRKYEVLADHLPGEKRWGEELREEGERGEVYPEKLLLQKRGLSGIAFTEGFEDSLVERILVEEALKKLSEEERELLLLRYGNGEALEEIAEIYGISRFALYRRLKKAERQFRKFMDN